MFLKDLAPFRSTSFKADLRAVWRTSGLGMAKAIAVIDTLVITFHFYLPNLKHYDLTRPD